MKHGANIYKYASKLGCDSSQIIDFSSNINSYHPNITVTPTTDMLVKYGDSNYIELKKSIKKKYNLQNGQIALYNGATSAIFALLSFIKEKKTYLYAPLYGEYEKASKEYDKKIVKINRFKNLYQKPKKNSTVIFVNPSTPDGQFYDIEKLLNYWHEQNCTVLIDELFLDFTNEQSVIKYLDKYSNLYILKSMTKFYSSAGIRVGCIVSNTNNIQNLKANEPMWKLSQFDSHYLQEALKDEEFKEKSKVINNTNRDMLKKVLEDSSLFEKVFDTYANYFLVQLKDIKSYEFQELLKAYKIMIRDCSNFDFLDENYIRIAVKSQYQNQKIIKSCFLDVCKINFFFIYYR